jgi:colanic acid biosynthesis glycosyl transferase WcaI
LNRDTVRALLLNQAFYPDVVSTAQHAADLAAALVDRGHAVTVVCSRRAYDEPGREYARRENWRGVNIRRIPSTGFGKTRRWRRGADFGSYLLSLAFHLLTLGRFDLVIGMTSPPLISWVAALFTRVTGGKFVFWVMDLNPDEALAAGWLRERSWTTRILQKLLHDSLRWATLVIVLDRFMAARVLAKGVDAGKIAILPPWSHDVAVQYDAAGREQFRKKHGLAGRYVVMYSGNHSPCHPLITLLDAARALRERHDIAFCFVGGGSEYQAVQRYAAQHGLKNISTIPYQPLDRLGASLSSADLHVVVMGDLFVGLVHPCKVYNIRTLGLPYLYIGPLESHVSELAPSFTATHGDVGTVVRHVENASRSAPRRIDPGIHASHGQTWLVGRMVAALEGAALARQTPPDYVHESRRA